MQADLIHYAKENIHGDASFHRAIELGFISRDKDIMTGCCYSSKCV